VTKDAATWRETCGRYRDRRREHTHDLQLLYAVYQLVRISLDLAAMSTLKFWVGAYGVVARLWRPAAARRKDLAIERQARSLDDFERLSGEGEGGRRWSGASRPRTSRPACSR
jgi:hypothetical protein